MNNNELAHHGVKGQKKGHRRYQNKDGSLTELGRIHYGIGIGEGADARYDKKVQTKTTASEGKASDSFINSKGGTSTKSLSRDDKKVQKALEKAMKKSIKEDKKEQTEKDKADEAKRKLEEIKEKQQESAKKEDKEESKKEEPKKEEPKKEEPKKEESKKENDYESRKTDYDNRKKEFDLEKSERQLKDDQTAEANKPHNDKMDRQSKDLKTGAELAKQASIGSTYASKATKEIGKVDNTKRMREELKGMSNEQIREINDRLTLENRYKELNKDRMTKGFEAVHNFFNIATPVIGLLGSSLAVAAQIKELRKK